MTQSTTADPRPDVVLILEPMSDEDRVQRTLAMLCPLLDRIDAAEAEIVALRALLARLVDPDVQGFTSGDSCYGGPPCCGFCFVTPEYGDEHTIGCPVREAEERLAAS